MMEVIFSHIFLPSNKQVIQVNIIALSLLQVTVTRNLKKSARTILSHCCIENKVLYIVRRYKQRVNSRDDSVYLTKFLPIESMEAKNEPHNFISHVARGSSPPSTNQQQQHAIEVSVTAVCRLLVYLKISDLRAMTCETIQ